VHLRRSLAILFALITLLALPAAEALAYGKADQPLAQLEFSGNCDNPSFPLCAPPPGGVGTGGIWFWVEIDAGGSGDIRGAECIHTIGGHGPVGAVSINGDVTWVQGSAADFPPGTFAVGTDPNDSYYIVTLEQGDVFAFPVTQGHYSLHPVSGVAIEATVAP